MTDCKRRYVIIELDDAKLLAHTLQQYSPNETSVFPIIERIESETGADIEDIVAQLKSIGPCPACVIEGQEHSCCAWAAQRLGRRLRRLIDRANAHQETS